MKDKNATLNKKLKSYSALAGSLIAIGTTADAQVVYTDVSPDSTVTAGGIYNLDLNNDGTTDFTLAQRSGTIYSFAYDAVGVNPAYLMNAVDTLGQQAAHAVNAGFSVDSTLNWVDSTAMAIQFPPTASALGAVIPLAGYAIGNFLGQNGKFLPLRFEATGNTYYGWVRLNVAADALSFTVIDYAYLNNPDVVCITGSLVGISESALNGKINIFSYGKNITVKLDNQLPLEGFIEIRNVLGQNIKTITITNSEMTIPMDEVATGGYMVTITQKTGAYTKKVIIK